MLKQETRNTANTSSVFFHNKLIGFERLLGQMRNNF